MIARAIAKHPAERYQTGMEMVLDLQRLRNQIELEGNRTDQAADLKDVFSSPSSGSNGYILGAGTVPQNRVQRTEWTTAPARFTRPWQQLSIAFLTLGFLALSFVGLWRVIPIKAAPRTAKIPSNPTLGIQNVATKGSDQNSTGSLRATAIQLSAANPAAKVHPNDAQRTNSIPDHSRSCKLGIAVEHHFVMADLTVWIDDQSSYSHSLRGAIKKRVVLFKGVEGYLSDELQLTPGVHGIRV
ncbi:MAG TPA: hypothetical protein VFE61_19415, partial [Candidatus Sulfotelmatobacter sp.]|nr:hypothetical protein [Candidatus Sulfotelmatobacter sp.]